MRTEITLSFADALEALFVLNTFISKQDSLTSPREDAINRVIEALEFADRIVIGGDDSGSDTNDSD